MTVREMNVRTMPPVWIHTTRTPATVQQGLKEATAKVCYFVHERRLKPLNLACEK